MSSSRPMEATESPTKAGQKYRRSSKPVAGTERRRCEYYLCPTFDALEVAVTPRQRAKQMGTLFKNSLAQLESLAAAISFLHLLCFPLGLVVFIVINLEVHLQVLGGLSVGRLRFADMQQQFQGLCEKREEAVQAAMKDREDLYNCWDELKEAHEMVKCHDHAIFIAEKEMEHVWAEKDKARQS